MRMRVYGPVHAVLESQAAESPFLMPTKVLVADDSKLVREAVMRFFSGDRDIQTVGQAESFAQTLELAGELRPEVIIMDLHMRDERSVNPADFRAKLNGAGLVAMSFWNDDETKALADCLGAAAFLDKTKLATDLIPAIKQCASRTAEG